MKPDNNVEELVKNLASIYVNGEEVQTDEQLSKPGWRMYESHQELVRKIRNLEDYDNDSDVARRAMMIGLQMMASPYVRDEFGQHVKDIQTGENNQ